MIGKTGSPRKLGQQSSKLPRMDKMASDSLVTVGCVYFGSAREAAWWWIFVLSRQVGSGAALTDIPTQHSLRPGNQPNELANPWGFGLFSRKLQPYPGMTDSNWLAHVFGARNESPLVDGSLVNQWWQLWRSKTLQFPDCNWGTPTVSVPSSSGKPIRWSPCERWRQPCDIQEASVASKKDAPLPRPAGGAEPRCTSVGYEGHDHERWSHVAMGQY